MMILRRLDAWLAKTLFHPPIILACQRTRQTQYAMHKALWFMAACHAAYYAHGSSWLAITVIWLYVITLFIVAVAIPDEPMASFGPFRFVLWLFVIADWIRTLATGEVQPWQLREIIILFAEYAATIRTIPPRKKRQRRTSGKEAFHGQ